MAVPTSNGTRPDLTSSGLPRHVERFEGVAERVIFGSRWLLAPLYLGLVVTLAVLVARFVIALWHLVRLGSSVEYSEVILGILSLLDITLLANLVLIVIFAGYETFVSKIDVARTSRDRPHWMGRVDFSGLKLKLIGSLVAISLISLLQDFLRAERQPINPDEGWRIAIHVTFVMSGLLFAITDHIAARTVIMEEREGEFVPGSEFQLDGGGTTPSTA